MSAISNKRILISGGGIGGLTLAYFLKQYGFTPVIVESAPEFKRKGYLLALNAQIGQKVAEKMGVMDKLKKFEVPMTDNFMYDTAGKLLLGFKLDLETLNERVGLMLNRADLHFTLYDAVKNDVEFRMGEEITSMRQADNGVQVMLKSGKEESFDLVIGADGVHSGVRGYIFGQGFEKHMGYAYFAFSAENHEIATELKEREIKIIRGDGFVIAYLRLKGNEIGAYVFHKEVAPENVTVEGRRDYLLKQYGEYDQNFKKILEGMNEKAYIFHDGFIKVVMPTWYKDRVCLIGDAAHCPTPASGVGASMAMAGAYVLSKKLFEADGDYKKAFADYDAYLRPYIHKAQSSAARMLILAAGGSFIVRKITTNE